MAELPRPDLIVFSGIPGTGKSTLATAFGRISGVAVLEKDIVEAGLLNGGVTKAMNSAWLAYEVLTSLIEMFLRSETSVAVVAVVPSSRLRAQRRDVAERHHARFVVIECVCSDEREQQRRIESRSRAIRGLPEIDWAEAMRSKAACAPWEGERLIVNAMNSLDANLRSVLAYLGDTPGTSP